MVFFSLNLKRNFAVTEMSDSFENSMWQNSLICYSSLIPYLLGNMASSAPYEANRYKKEVLFFKSIRLVISAISKNISHTSPINLNRKFPLFSAYF